MTDQPTPAEWAIELALEPVNAGLTYKLFTLEAVKSSMPRSSFGYSILAHAAMIEKYEPHRKPVDPLLEEARKIVSGRYRWVNAGPMSMVITALRRGMELAREADHGTPD